MCARKKEKPKRQCLGEQSWLILELAVVVFDDGSLDIEFEVVKSAGADDNNTSGNTVSNNTNSGTTAPKTGDNASVMFFIMILCASGAAIMVTRRKRI